MAAHDIKAPSTTAATASTTTTEIETNKKRTSMPGHKAMAAISVSIGLLSMYAYAQSANKNSALPPQAVFVDPKSFAVLGPNGTFRQNAFNQTFNPTSTPAPFFQVFDTDFLDVLGEQATITQVAANDTFAFAHEAPIYVPETDEVFFAANDGGALGMSDLEHNSLVGKISFADVQKALAGSTNGSNVSVPVTELSLDALQMTNGGTGPYKNNLLFITSGRGDRPPSIVLVNPKPPYNATVLLDNYFGRQFNSLNDIKVHPSGKLFFTDVIYGFINAFRPPPQLPNQVYMMDPDTGAVRVVADGFDKCNGIAFTQDGKTAYIADTGAAGGVVIPNNQTEPATLYKFDVDPVSHLFKNRRTFAYIDTGVPDGIQVDTKGNVYAGCGDGVQVWDQTGKLLGKFFVNQTSANMVFAGPDLGTLVILAETKIFVAQIAARGFKLSPV